MSIVMVSDLHVFVLTLLSSTITYIWQESHHIDSADRESLSATGEESSRGSPPSKVGADMSQASR
jgi:hypothetical protein